MSFDSSGIPLATGQMTPAELQAKESQALEAHIKREVARRLGDPLPDRTVDTTLSISTTPPKPGIKTTEFPVAVIGQIIGGILVATGRVTQGEVDAIVTITPQVVGGLISLGSTIAYIWSRTRTKQAAAGVRR